MIVGLARGVRRRVRSGWAVLWEPPVYAPRHFYSPHTARQDRRRATTWRQQVPQGIDVREREQLGLAGELAPAMAELRDGARYVSDAAVNNQFGPADAATLHAMLRHLRPARYLEVGSGFSTAVALDTAESHLSGLEITCIEPYPARLRSRLRPGDRVEIIERPVQAVDPSRFERLQAGDVLFIDSTHVVKSGSDVVYLLLHILPMLRTGVVVHVHDIHWPFEYRPEWLAEGRDWNEVYLVRALLTDSRRWQILLMTSWLWSAHPEVLPVSLRCDPMDTGSLWIRAGG